MPDTLKTLRKLGSTVGLKSQHAKDFYPKLKPLLENGSPKPLFWFVVKSSKNCSKLKDLIVLEQIGGVEIVADPQSKQFCRVEIIPSQFPSKKRAFKNLALMLNITDQEMTELVAAASKKAKGLGQFKPVLVMSDISFEAYARI